MCPNLSASHYEITTTVKSPFSYLGKYGITEAKT